MALLEFLNLSMSQPLSLIHATPNLEDKADSWTDQRDKMVRGRKEIIKNNVVRMFPRESVIPMQHI